jgi:hypothetical protein
VAESPFVVLGLEPGREYSDDDIRVAWRRISTATSPDRADGGDPARFAAASAAYAELATGYGRGEAAADLADSQGTAGPVRRVRAGRSWFLVVRVLIAVAVCWECVAVAGWQPATLALTVGALTWLAVTAMPGHP